MGKGIGDAVSAVAAYFENHPDHAKLLAQGAAAVGKHVSNHLNGPTTVTASAGITEGPAEGSTTVSQPAEAEPARKGNMFGNAFTSIGSALQKVGNVADVVPILGDGAAAVIEVTSTVSNVIGEALNGNFRGAANKAIMGITKAALDVGEAFIPGSDYIDLAAAAVTGSTLSTSIGQGLADMVVKNPDDQKPEAAKSNGLAGITIVAPDKSGTFEIPTSATTTPKSAGLAQAQVER